MPKIKLDHVVSFSSEDSDYPANNLLSEDPKKPWKSKTKGELSINVVLQLEKAIVINSIDIGNEHSAFVEVLVARSTAKENNYEVLLVTSSFMTPLESRQSTNTNRVRMFTAEQFSKPVWKEKWDRVKIVCTQPFNKQIQYGLSFITMHSPQEVIPPIKDINTIGAFKIKPPSPTPYKAGLLFTMRKDLEEKENPKTIAESIKNANLGKCEERKRIVITPPTIQKNNDCPPSTSAEPKIRNRNEIFYDEDDEKPHKKIDKIIERSKKNKEAKEGMKPSEKPPQKNVTTSETKRKKTHNDNMKRKTDETNKRTESTKKIKVKLCKPFHELLRGVILVISGIQNPDRAVLRTLAMEMGAKYKSDWDHSCTHLICAFPNTPKFNQVRGKGKIVTRKWIEDCHCRRKRFPWRRYALDSADVGKPESEEEVEESVEPEEQEAEPQTSGNERRNVTEDDYRRSPELHQPIEVKSDSDTELEEKGEVNAFEVDTDEENLCTEKEAEFVMDIPELFEQKMFYIDCDLNKSRNQLERYIEAMNGIVIHNGCDVDYVITNVAKCCEEREEIENVNGNVTVVRPDWIYDCYKKKVLMPLTNYKVS